MKHFLDVFINILSFFFFFFFLAHTSLLPHCSRQKFMGFKVALDDDGTAEGWLFWDDGQSIGE